MLSLLTATLIGSVPSGGAGLYMWAGAGLIAATLNLLSLGLAIRFLIRRRESDRAIAIVCGGAGILMTLLI